MQEKRVLFTRTHPRKHAQEAIFPVIYSVFFHISNTDFDPQKSTNHRAPPPPPWLPQKNVSAFPTLSVIKPVKSLFPKSNMGNVEDLQDIPNLSTEDIDHSQVKLGSVWRHHWVHPVVTIWF